MLDEESLFMQATLRMNRSRPSLPISTRTMTPSTTTSIPNPGCQCDLYKSCTSYDGLYSPHLILRYWFTRSRILEQDSSLSLLTTIKSRRYRHARRHLESYHIVPHARSDANVFIPHTFRVSRPGGHATQPSVALDGNAILGAHTAWVKQGRGWP